LGLVPKDRAKVDYPRLKGIVEAVRPGLHCLSELTKEADFFFRGPALGEEERNVLASDKSQKVLSTALEAIEAYPVQADPKDFASTLIEGLTPAAMQLPTNMAEREAEIRRRAFETRELMMTLRLALTGRAHGPELNAILSILGVEECKRRLRSALLVRTKG
jgi:glutamyl/glutaminyl-tRNA synthetase